MPDPVSAPRLVKQMPDTWATPGKDWIVDVHYNSIPPQGEAES